MWSFSTTQAHLHAACSKNGCSMSSVELLTLSADNTVVKGFGMGDRCSFFHMALIGLILRNTFVHSFSYWRIQGVPCEYSKIFFSVTQITGSPLDPAVTKRVHISVSEYQSNQCHVEKWASITHPEALLRYYLHEVLMFGKDVQGVDQC